MPSRPPVPALLAPFTAIGREFGELARNPIACIGGVLGSGLFAGAVAGLVLLATSLSHGKPPDADDELVMQYIPGDLVRLGEVHDELEKVVVDELQAAAAPASTTVTDDPNAAPNPEPTPAEPTPPTPSREKPDPQRDGARQSDRNQPSNTPYKDPATAERLRGDPFGSPGGWADRHKAGDPWATAVLAALNGMTVGSFAGLGQEATYKFQLVVCADGSVDDVRTKQSTGRPDFDGQIRNAITALKLPRAPADIAAQLAGKCKKIPYEFTWRGASRNGTVQ
jgi:outer membrane biosynthesis protein TonB